MLKVINQYNFESTMEELEALALTCQLDVIGQVTQNKRSI